jgi:protein-S-isoprenylcysteine O-methyltransferase Ste14
MMGWSFWIILFAILLYGVIHSLLASLQAKALARQWLGPGTDRWFRLFYNFIAVVTFLPILLLPAILADQPIYSIPYPWYILTGVLQIMALIILAVGVLQTGVMNFLGIQQLLGGADKGHPQLVVGGLYRYVRHPLYTAGLAFIWLIPTMTLNLLALNIGLTLYIMVGANFEERKMLKEYGGDYGQYQQQTPMLIPRFRLKK